MRDAKDVSVERASVDDGVEIADLYLASRADALPFLRRVQPDDEVRSWIQNVLLRRKARPGLLGWTDMWWDS
jgi:hypothetical protein